MFDKVKLHFDAFKLPQTKDTLKEIYDQCLVVGKFLNSDEIIATEEHYQEIKNGNIYVQHWSIEKD